MVRSAIEGAFRNDLGDHGAEAFTRNLAQHDPSGNVTRKLSTGQPLNPGDHLALSRAYHDSLPIDISRPPSPKTANTINHIVRDYSIFSNRMPGGAEAASHPLVTALHKNLGTAATENLFRRASSSTPLFNTIDKIYRGEPLTPLDTRILGHNFESIAKANDPYVASAISSQAEKAAVGVRNRFHLFKRQNQPNLPQLRNRLNKKKK